MDNIRERSPDLLQEEKGLRKSLRDYYAVSTHHQVTDQMYFDIIVNNLRTLQSDSAMRYYVEEDPHVHKIPPSIRKPYEDEIPYDSDLENSISLEAANIVTPISTSRTRDSLSPSEVSVTSEDSDYRLDEEMSTSSDDDEEDDSVHVERVNDNDSDVADCSMSDEIPNGNSDDDDSFSDF